MMSPASDPLLLELETAFSDRNAVSMAATLDKMCAESSSSSSRQEVLGNSDCISVIMDFIKERLSSYSTESVVIDDASSSTSSSSMTKPQAGMMKEHEQLVGKCYWALLRLCRRDITKSTTNTANIELIENYPQSYEIIMNMSRLLVGYSEIAYPTCWLIMVFASDSAERQFRLTSANATSVIVNIISLHKEDGALAEMACRAARNIAAGDADIVAKFVEDKICDSLVSVLHVQLQQTSSIKMAVGDNITGKGTFHDNAPLNTESSAISNGEIYVGESVCEAALWAIVNLSCEESVSTIFGTAGAIEAVVDVASMCKSSGVAQAAVSAIRNLSCTGTLNYSLFAKTKVCEVLLSLLSNNSSDLEVIETGLWALTNLACDNVLSNRLGSLGVAKIVVDLYYSIVPLHPPEGRPAGPISEVCLWVILNLAASGLDNEDRLGEAGCCELVGLIMSTYVLREGMIELALNALVHLTYHSEGNKSRIGIVPSKEAQTDRIGCDIFPTLFNVMLSFRDNDSLAENVFKFLLLSLNGAATSSSHNKERLLSLGVTRLVAKILTAHALNTEVIRLGCGLLLVLYYKDEFYKQRLRERGQLDAAGKASPQGLFSEIALAWELELDP